MAEVAPGYTQHAGPFPLDEAEVLRRAQRGDRSAFGALVRIYGSRLHRAVFYLVRDSDDASDLTQETFFRAYRAISTFDPDRPFYPWLYRIARNLIATYGRKRTRSVALGDDDALIADEPHDPDIALIAEQESAALRRALSRLSAEQREIIVLKHFQKLRYAEIAEVLAIPVGTVMSRLYNARLKLRTILSKEELR